MSNPTANDWSNLLSRVLTLPDEKVSEVYDIMNTALTSKAISQVTNSAKPTVKAEVLIKSADKGFQLPKAG